MEEMLARMRALLDEVASTNEMTAGIRLRGMYDLLGAMENRVRTLKYRARCPGECSYPPVINLLEWA